MTLRQGRRPRGLEAGGGVSWPREEKKATLTSCTESCLFVPLPFFGEGSFCMGSATLTLQDDDLSAAKESPHFFLICKKDCPQSLPRVSHSERAIPSICETTQEFV